MRRLAVGGVAAAVVALVAATGAHAHATLRQGTPDSGRRLEAPPRTIVLRFDQAVDAFARSIEVRSATGRVVSGRARANEAARTMTVPLGRLARGGYTVRWHALSSDGHVISGVFTFGVRMNAPAVTEAFGARGPTRTEHVVRFAYFLALALLVGGLGFRLLVARGPLPVRAERRFFRLVGLGAVAVLDLGILAFLLRAHDALQLPLGRLLYGDLTPVAEDTRFGVAFIGMTLGFALVAALLFLAWLTDRVALLWPAFLLGLGFAAGLSLSGHSGAGGSWSAAVADWVHLASAMLWLGGLVTLVVVVWPAAPSLRRDAFLRFSRLATVLIALILGAGVYLSVLRLPAVADLWSTSYGRVLLVKIGLVALALLWGAFHHFVVRPALARPGSDRIAGRVPRSLAGESAVGMAILLVAAVLVDSKPPPAEPQPTQVVNVSP